MSKKKQTQKGDMMKVYIAMGGLEHDHDDVLGTSSDKDGAILKCAQHHSKNTNMTDDYYDEYYVVESGLNTNHIKMVWSKGAWEL